MLFYLITLKIKYHKAMNNNSCSSEWTPCSPPPFHHRQAAGNPRERKAKLNSSRCAFKFQGISKFHWTTKSSKTPVEDTQNLAISLTAEDSVSFKWLLNIQVHYFVQRHKPSIPLPTSYHKEALKDVQHPLVSQSWFKYVPNT